MLLQVLLQTCIKGSWVFQFLNLRKLRLRVENISKIFQNLEATGRRQRRQLLVDKGGNEDIELHTRVWSQFVDNSPSDLCEESKHILTFLRLRNNIWARVTPCLEC